MIPLQTLLDALETHLGDRRVLFDRVCRLMEELFQKKPHGYWPRWSKILHDLPQISPSTIDFDKDVLTIGKHSDISAKDSTRLYSLLQNLSPWRKGPYRFFDITVDAEWRCEKKWKRMERFLPDLRDKCVLDIGSGNGYFSWKCEQKGAKSVLAIDRNLLWFVQFLSVQHYVHSSKISFLPVALSDILCYESWNDLVLSMGLLYHQKDPLDHLKTLCGLLKKNGFLILETLYVSSDYAEIFFPQDRYAQMKNVHAIPSENILKQWLEQCGFSKVKCLNRSKTNSREQRCTEWMEGESLSDFLNPANPELTIENYPAPRRIMVLAQKS